jgi:DNA-binding NarL/FixJ family response regulator
MDLHMPDMNGTDATRAILEKNPKIKIIALTTDSDKRFIKQAFRAGASGYLLKDCALEELVQAIHTVRSGKRYLSATVSEIIVDGIASDSSGESKAVETPLTPRETEVLKLVAEGLSTKEIAVRLNMSTRTVESHRHAISEKLNLHSIAEMTRYAIKNNLISE